MRKLFNILTILSLLIIFGILAFGDNQVITIWSWRAQDAPVWQQVQSILNSEGINVTIKFTAFDPTQYDSKVNLALQTGTGPDIVYSRRLPGSQTESLIKTGLYLPVNENIDFSNFQQTILKSVTYNGKIYGVPFAVQVCGIFYNKNIYTKYNLSVPKTWDQLVDNAKTLKDHGVTPFFVAGKDAWTLAMQHAMCGVSILGPEWIKELTDGATDFLAPKWVQLNMLLNDLKTYYQPGFLANGTSDQSAAFAFGQAAMVFDGIFDYGVWVQLNPGIANNVGYFMVPPLSENDKPYAYSYMDGAFSLTSSCKNVPLALKVLQFTATPKFGTIFSNVTDNISAVSGAIMPDISILKQMTDVYENDSSSWVYWVGSVFTTGTPDLYNSVLSPGMQSMYAGKITPYQFADMAQKAISQWYKPLQDFINTHYNK